MFSIHFEPLESTIKICEKNVLPQDQRCYNDDDAHSPVADDKMIFEFSTANGGVYRFRAGNNYTLKRTTRLHRVATAAARCTLLAPSCLCISSLCSSSHHLESSKHCTIQTDEVNFYVQHTDIVYSNSSSSSSTYQRLVLCAPPLTNICLWGKEIPVLFRFFFYFAFLLLLCFCFGFSIFAVNHIHGPWHR